MSKKVPPKERKLDMAPSGRGSCKGCGDPFPEGSLRVAKQQTSAFHDGFETLYYHVRCHHSSGGHGAQGLAMVENLGNARTADQMELCSYIGVKLSKKCA